MHHRPRLSSRAAPATPAARSSRAVLAGLVTATLGLAGCSSAVDVAVPAHAGSAACTAAARHWPSTVGGLHSRATTSDSPAVAAWGDPAVVARCGVTPPGPTTKECIDVSGVDWVVTSLSDGASFTTFGTDPAIQVLVPSAYSPEPLLLPAFGAAASRLPPNGRSCS